MVVASAVARQAFDRDGFVMVPDVLTADELHRYGVAVDAAVSARVGDDDRPMSEKSRYEQTFQQCMNMWEDDLAVRELTFHEGLGELAASLLGADRLRIWIDQALYKQPGSRPTDPHQDWPLWPITPARQITAWIPLDGSTIESGAMGYRPGSHRMGIATFDTMERTIRATAHGDDVPYPSIDHRDLPDPVWVEAPAGSVVLHHSMTVHQAGPNNSSQPRRVHTIAYFEDGCCRSSAHPHQSVDRQGTEPGRPVAGVVTPVVWPRPPGDMVETPSASGAGKPPRTGFR